MATNLDIDSSLIEEARIISSKSTKKAAVIEALQEYIQKRKQLKITEFFGKIDYDSNYNYKKQRIVK